MKWPRILFVLGLLIVSFLVFQMFSERTYLHWTKQSLRSWVEANYENPKAQEVLSHSSAPVRPLLIELLQDPDERVKINTLQMLAELHATEAVPAVIPLLSSKNWRVRFFSAEALRRLEDRKVLDPLLSAWAVETDSRVCLQVAIAIAKFGDEKAVPVLRSAFQGNDPDRKVLAAIALLKLSGEPSVKTYLREILKTAEVRLKSLTLFALAETGDSSDVLDLLELATQDEDPKIREKAHKYLKRLQGRDVGE